MTSHITLHLLAKIPYAFGLKFVVKKSTSSQKLIKHSPYMAIDEPVSYRLHGSC